MSELVTPGPIDRTPGIPGSDKNTQVTNVPPEIWCRLHWSNIKMKNNVRKEIFWQQLAALLERGDADVEVFQSLHPAIGYPTHPPPPHRQSSIFTRLHFISPLPYIHLTLSTLCYWFWIALFPLDPSEFSICSVERGSWKLEGHQGPRLGRRIHFPHNNWSVCKNTHDIPSTI